MKICPHGPIEIVYCIKHITVIGWDCISGKLCPGDGIKAAFLCHLCKYGHLCKYVDVCTNGPIEIEIVSAGIVSEESRVLGFKLESGHRPTRPEERTSESDSESVAPLHVSLNYMCEICDFSPLCVFCKWVF